MHTLAAHLYLALTLQEAIFLCPKNPRFWITMDHPPLKLLNLSFPNLCCFHTLPPVLLPIKTARKALPKLSLPLSASPLTGSLPWSLPRRPAWHPLPTVFRVCELQLLPSGQSFPHWHVLPRLMETNPGYIVKQLAMVPRLESTDGHKECDKQLFTKWKNYFKGWNLTHHTVL